MHLIEPPKSRAKKSPAGVKTSVAAAPAVSSMAEQIELHADDVLGAADSENAGVPVLEDGPDDPGPPQHDDVPTMPAVGDESNRATRLSSQPAQEYPATALFTPEPMTVNRINPPQNGANREVLMKSQNENQPFDQITRQVGRIIFGDETLSEMSLRLTRIALERYNVPEIINRVPDSNSRVNGANPTGANADPFHQVACEVARIVFGDEGLSEMHLRLTRIALERYNVPEIMNRPLKTNGRNGSLEEHVPSLVIDSQLA